MSSARAPPGSLSAADAGKPLSAAARQALGQAVTGAGHASRGAVVGTMAHTTKKMKLKRTMREVLDDEASAPGVAEQTARALLCVLSGRVKQRTARISLGPVGVLSE